MSEIYSRLREALRTEKRCVLATIVREAGSVPREVGTQMLVCSDGLLAGTVGGGAAEGRAIQSAQAILAGEPAHVLRAELTNEIGLENDGVCGGWMEYFLEPWPVPGHSSAEALALLDVLCQPLDPPSALLMRLSPAPTAHAVLGSGGLLAGTAPETTLQAAAGHLAERHSALLRPTEGEDTWFLHVPQPRPTLVIVGAGHIAGPLGQIADLTDFRVVVIDDRPEWANASRFPYAAQIICRPYEQALHDLPIHSDTYIVIVTRGHKHDLASLMAVVDSPAGYIGMIGSRRRINGVMALLEEEQGIPRHRLQRVFAPIGIDIAAQTPAEIAISILAELIRVYRGGKAPSISDYRRAGIN